MHFNYLFIYLFIYTFIRNDINIIFVVIINLKTPLNPSQFAR